MVLSSDMSAEEVKNNVLILKNYVKDNPKIEYDITFVKLKKMEVK